MVKADAYGHGALEVARVVPKARGGWRSAPSTKACASHARHRGPRILVMGGFLPYEGKR